MKVGSAHLRDRRDRRRRRAGGGGRGPAVSSHSGFRAHAHPDQPGERVVPRSGTAARVLAHPRPVRRTDLAAAATSKLRVGTGVCLLAQHDPIVTAKAAATLDLVSAGRFLFGVGLGWNLEEMRDHGVDPATRRSRAREVVAGHARAVDAGEVRLPGPVHLVRGVVAVAEARSAAAAAAHRRRPRRHPGLPRYRRVRRRVLARTVGDPRRAEPAPVLGHPHQHAAPPCRSIPTTCRPSYTSVIGASLAWWRRMLGNFFQHPPGSGRLRSFIASGAPFRIHHAARA